MILHITACDRIRNLGLNTNSIVLRGRRTHVLSPFY